MQTIGLEWWRQLQRHRGPGDSLPHPGGGCAMTIEPLLGQE